MLKDVTGVMRAASMTLVLGPPGSGKTSLLKLLAGRLRSDGSAKLTGDVRLFPRLLVRLLCSTSHTRWIYLNKSARRTLSFEAPFEKMVRIWFGVVCVVFGRTTM